MKYIFTFLIVAFTSAIANSQELNNVENINKMTWLVGSWKGMYNDKPFYEAWRKFNDNVLVNFSIEINGNDTIVKESNAIVIKDGKASYGKEPNIWNLVKLTEKEIVLEMAPPKFHNRIIWMHTSNDHWLTFIQQPKTTLNYDIVRMPQLDGVVDRFIASAKK